MKPQLIIFDFDGTLADTTAAILKTYRMAIKSIGAERRTDTQCQATIGLPLKEGFRQLYPDFADEQLDNCVNNYRRIFNENKKNLVPELYPGVKDTLGKLAAMGIRMTIASSRSRESLIEFCDENGITQYFDMILGADDVTHAKPNPEPVLITLERMNVGCENALVVGDMPVDIEMGRGAGCETVGVTYGNSSIDSLKAANPGQMIDKFSDILEIR